MIKYGKRSIKRNGGLYTMKKNKRCVFLLLAATILFSAVIIPTSMAKAVAVTQMSSPVAGGTSHSIALKNDGTIWAWGSNLQLQVGQDGDLKEQPVPEQVEVEEDSMFVSVAAGYDFSLALRHDGHVLVLGERGYAPVYEVPLSSFILAIAAGQTDGLALDRDGVVWQWTIGGAPRKVPNLSGVAAIAAGGAHYFALTYSGDVWAWGANFSGQLGNGTAIDAPVPEKVRNLANIVYIAAGYSHTLAINHKGYVYAWGSNTYGQLGDETTDTSYLPVLVSGLKDVVQVSAGNESSMALTKDNVIYTWGYGEFGQLGDDTATISQETPAAIETEGTPIYIASGGNHNFYIDSLGELYAWGRNRNNMLGTGDKLNKTVPFAVFDNMAESRRCPSDPIKGASAWAVPELEELYKMDFLPPMLFGDYQNNVTRAEFAGLLIDMHESINGAEIKLEGSAVFEDIENHVFELEIEKAFEIGLVSGVSETRYNPEGLITRQEAAKMIVAFICIIEGFPEPTWGSVSQYMDADIVQVWAVPYVAFASDNDIMQGSGGDFNPLDNLTRQQILAMIYRTILKYGWVRKV